ncbi:peptide deformylase, partial [Pseudomonas aeruginosa]
MIREILKMGDERLLRIAQPVPSELFGSEELQRLIDDMFETMHHVGG